MELSVLITSLPTSFEESLRALAQLGFRHVDLIGKSERSDDERNALAESGLIVDCVALGRDLPIGCALDAEELENRRLAVEEVKKQITDAAQLGARIAYLVPGKTPATLWAFADACNTLAAFARGRMMQLCIEHFPGSALPSAAGTLDWLRTNDLDVKLLLDLGHCLISREDPITVVAKAGTRLGYVQLDDNDGIGDLHWPLLTGELRGPVLRWFLNCLRHSKERVGIALELNGKLDDALGNVRKSKQIVDEMWR